MAGNLDSRTGLVYLIKQPAESRKYTMDFTALLGGSTISSVTSVAQANQGLVTSSSAVTLGSATFSGVNAQIQISAGTNLEDYKITFTVVDGSSNTLQAEGILKVRDL